MNPNIEIFNEDVLSAGYQSGFSNGRWGILDDSNERPTWPFITIWVSAASREKSPDKYHFKFDLEKYNQGIPTACIWDVEENLPLEDGKRPKMSVPYELVFRTNWQKGQALYIPFDRTCWNTHDPKWKEQYKHLSWKPGEDKIDKYLKYLWKILNGECYHGIKNPN